MEIREWQIGMNLRKFVPAIGAQFPRVSLHPIGPQMAQKIAFHTIFLEHVIPIYF